MKRIDNIYDTICSLDNLRAADSVARAGKSKQRDVIRHKLKQEENIQHIHTVLSAGTYKISPYKIFKIIDPKEREVYSLPYHDRIVQHAIMIPLEPVLTAMFTADTYSCIKSRGIHAAVYKLRRILKDKANTTYCLKLDIRKFYPSIDHDILKALLRRKFKDERLLTLIDGIIDSAPGLPIGSYISQHFANFYLTWFNHWLKEQKKVKYYFRYCDDLVILSDNKAFLHQILADIREYLQMELKLTVKKNYQIFPVAARGIDFLGYVFFHTHILIRKSIKQKGARKLSGNSSIATKASYKGWFKHGNCRNLERKLFKNAA